MSTLRINRRVTRMSKFGFVSLIALAAAGCSENSARFTDPLFTASTVSPTAVDKFGNPLLPNQSTNVANVTLQPEPPRTKQVFPQRVDIVGQQTRHTPVFTARNVNRFAKERNFQPGALDGAVAQQNQLVQQQQQFNSIPLQQQPLPQSDTFAQSSPIVQRESLPPVQQDFSSVNDTAESFTAPLHQSKQPAANQQVALAQPTPSQSLPPLPGAQSAATFPSGTEWTREYSPLPTLSPQPKLSGPAPTSTLPSSNTGLPRAYTPPQGTYTSNIDRTPTASIGRLTSPPKVIRSSVKQTVAARPNAPTVIAPQVPGVDYTTTSSIKPATASPLRQASNDPQGWTSAGGTAITVRQGDTLYSISRRYGVPVNTLTKVNNIQNPSEVKAGKSLIIPTYVYSPNAPVSAPDADKRVREARSISAPQPATVQSKVALSQPLPPKLQQPLPLPLTTAQAPVQTASSSQPASVTSGTYTVKPGDTLFKISKRTNFRMASIQSANGLKENDVLRVGQVLRLPGETSPTLAAAPIIDPVRTSSVQPQIVLQPKQALVSLPKQRPGPRVVDTIALPKKVVTAKVPEVKSQQVARLSLDSLPRLDAAPAGARPYKAPTVQNQQVASLGEQSVPTQNAGSFRWPVKGQIVSGFGAELDGRRNDGIDIAIPVGTPVRAAAAGEVIYASNGLKGYGNLVLIRHANGYVSAYAYNSEIKVRRGDKIRQGQIVAKSGQSGAAKEPTLHFELREGKVPVDPLGHLS